MKTLKLDDDDVRVLLALLDAHLFIRRDFSSDSDEQDALRIRRILADTLAQSDTRPRGMGDLL